MAARHSYLFHILRNLRLSPENGSLDNIFDNLTQAKKKLELAEGGPLHLPSKATLSDVLNDLAQIGVLRAHREREGYEFWTLAAGAGGWKGDENAAPEDHHGEFDNSRDGDGDGDGDGGGRGGSGPGSGNPNGEGGRGLSEVLSHPVLFCFTEEDQEQLLRAALSLSPNGLDANDGETV